MKTEIEEFLKQYPQYNDTTTYVVESRATTRYGGDYEIIVWETFDEGAPEEYVGCWWCQIWNNEAETTYEFEEEEPVNVLYLIADIDTVDLGNVYYDWDDNDPRYSTDIEESVELQYKKDNLEQIKKMLCEKIMNNEIKINIRTHDGDSYNAPKSRIKKIYKV